MRGSIVGSRHAMNLSWPRGRASCKPFGSCFEHHYRAAVGPSRSHRPRCVPKTRPGHCRQRRGECPVALRLAMRTGNPQSGTNLWTGTNLWNQWRNGHLESQPSSAHWPPKLIAWSLGMLTFCKSCSARLLPCDATTTRRRTRHRLHLLLPL
jgi:hypothetical protein